MYTTWGKPDCYIYISTGSHISGQGRWVRELYYVTCTSACSTKFSYVVDHEYHEKIEQQWVHVCAFGVYESHCPFGSMPMNERYEIF
jgi:hypothetical protein